MAHCIKPSLLISSNNINTPSSSSVLTFLPSLLVTEGTAADNEEEELDANVTIESDDTTEQIDNIMMASSTTRTATQQQYSHDDKENMPPEVPITVRFRACVCVCVCVHMHIYYTCIMHAPSF